MEQIYPLTEEVINRYRGMPVCAVMKNGMRYVGTLDECRKGLVQLAIGSPMAYGPRPTAEPATAGADMPQERRLASGRKTGAKSGKRGRKHSARQSHKLKAAARTSNTKAATTKRATTRKAATEDASTGAATTRAATTLSTSSIKYETGRPNPSLANKNHEEDGILKLELQHVLFLVLIV